MRMSTHRPKSRTPILILRFPDGDVEHRSRFEEFPVGTLVRARGCVWRVDAHERGAVCLEIAETPDSDGAPTGPVVTPTAFEDRPLTVEILVEA